jgi:hypothetical protein
MLCFLCYHRLCNKSNTTGVTSGAGTAYPSGAPEFTPVFSGIRVARSLVLCVVFGITLFAILSFLIFGHCDVCPSIYGYRLPFWYLQTFLKLSLGCCMIK